MKITVAPALTAHITQLQDAIKMLVYLRG